MYTDLISDINKSLDIILKDSLSDEQLRNQLALHINHLINHDFEKLVFYLYRIDVNENKMKDLLEQREGKNAAELIADLIIERQLQKIESRKKFCNNEDIDENEEW
jgi:uncharacterized protein YwgA